MALGRTRAEEGFLELLSAEEREGYGTVMDYLSSLGYRPVKLSGRGVILSYQHPVHKKQITKMGLRPNEEARFWPSASPPARSIRRNFVRPSERGPCWRGMLPCVSAADCAARRSIPIPTRLRAGRRGRAAGPMPLSCPAGERRISRRLKTCCGNSTAFLCCPHNLAQFKTTGRLSLSLFSG